MSDLKDYKQLFDQIHTNKEIHMSDYKKKSKHLWRNIIVATLCLTVGSAGVVYAFDLFDLRSRVVEGKMNTYDESGQPAGAEYYEALTMQSAMESNEYKATAEWNAFVDNYDVDLAILSEVGNDPTEFDEKYSEYNVYSQEMADKLEEIIAKYDLKLLKGWQETKTKEELYEMINTEAFIGDNNTLWSGYAYEDGTFQYDGDVQINSDVTLDYQLRNSKKGVLDPVVLNIGSADDYTERSYETKSGVAVTIATSPDKIIIIAPLEESTVTINLFPTTASGEPIAIDDKEIEQVADSIDFAKLK